MTHPPSLKLKKGPGSVIDGRIDCDKGLLDRTFADMLEEVRENISKLLGTLSER